MVTNSITGLPTIDYNGTSTTYVCLFGSIGNSMIKNAMIVAGHVEGAQRVGGLAG